MRHFHMLWWPILSVTDSTHLVTIKRTHSTHVSLSVECCVFWECRDTGKCLLPVVPVLSIYHLTQTLWAQKRLLHNYSHLTVLFQQSNDGLTITLWVWPKCASDRPKVNTGLVIKPGRKIVGESNTGPRQRVGYINFCNANQGRAKNNKETASLNWDQSLPVPVVLPDKMGPSLSEYTQQ